MVNWILIVHFYYYTFNMQINIGRKFKFSDQVRQNTFRHTNEYNMSMYKNCLLAEKDF